MGIVYVVTSHSEERLKRAYESHSLDIPFLLRNDTSVELQNGATYKFDLGVQTYTDPNVGGILLIPRSSSSFVHRERTPVEGQSYHDVPSWRTSCLKLANTIGYIDWDYRGSWSACINYDAGEFDEEDLDRMSFTVTPDSKPYLQAVPLNPFYRFVVVNNISEVPEELVSTLRGEKGYGSSDKV